MKRLQLGELLISLGSIDRMQLQVAIAHQQQWGMPIGRAIVEKRFCTQEQVLHALSIQSGIPAMQLTPQMLDLELAKVITQKVAEQYRVVPLKLAGKRAEILEVAIAAPATLQALDAARAVSGKQRIVAHLAGDHDLERAIGLLYRGYADTAPPEVIPHGEVHLPRESLFEAPSEPPPEAQQLLIYGWPDSAARALQTLLGRDLPRIARAAGAEDVKAAGPTSIVLAPLPALEALFPEGPPNLYLIAAVKAPETDLYRAQRLGAKGYLATPLDPELVLRAVHRCLRLRTETASHAT